VRSAAQSLKVTPYLLFHAAWSIVLRERTQTERFILWTNFHNRATRDTQDAVGWLVNAHAIGVDCTETSSGVALLQRLVVQLKEATRWQFIPLAHLWRALGACWDTANLRVIIDYVRERSSTLADGTRLSPYGLKPVTGEFHLHVVIADCGPTFECRAYYSAECFDEQDIGRMLTRLRSVVVALSTRPEARIALY